MAPPLKLEFLKNTLPVLMVSQKYKQADNRIFYAYIIFIISYHS